MSETLDVQWCREQFPALAMEIGSEPAVFFDGRWLAVGLFEPRDAAVTHEQTVGPERR